MRRALALAPLLTALALPAGAEPLRARLFPEDAACYMRLYGADHLAGHPQQRVTRLALIGEPGQSDASTLVATLRVDIRGSAETYVGSAYCQGEGDSLSCGMEGDAGHFTLSPARMGVLLRVDGAISFEGQGDFLTLSGETGDDRLFLLPLVGTGCL